MSSFYALACFSDVREMLRSSMLDYVPMKPKTMGLSSTMQLPMPFGFYAPGPGRRVIVWVLSNSDVHCQLKYPFSKLLTV